tara:strand:- start:594 stop:1205 length:612 start_codon:yes stop_codon:yes gene_type:complete
MFNKSIIFSKDARLDFIAKLCLGILVSAVISPLIWQVSPTVNVLFGSLIVCLIPATFGWRVGGLAALTYVILGGIGLPVFAGHQGGIHYFIPVPDPEKKEFYDLTGFLYGYVMASFLVGFLAEKLESIQIVKTFGLFTLAHIIIVGLGFWHKAQIHGSKFELWSELKELLPSFGIKAGLFLIILQMIDRRVNYDTIHGKTDSE